MAPLPRNKVLWGKKEGAENNATYRPEPVPALQCHYPLLGQKKNSHRICLLASSQTPELVSHQLLSIRQPGYEWTIPVTLPLGSVPPAASANLEEAPDGTGLGSEHSQSRAHYPQPGTLPSSDRTASPVSDRELSASWTNHSSSKATSLGRERRTLVPTAVAGTVLSASALPLGTCSGWAEGWILVKRLALSQTVKSGESPPLSGPDSLAEERLEQRETAMPRLRAWRAGLQNDVTGCCSPAPFQWRQEVWKEEAG